MPPRCSDGCFAAKVAFPAMLCRRGAFGGCFAAEVLGRVSDGCFAAEVADVSGRWFTAEVIGISGRCYAAEVAEIG